MLNLNDLRFFVQAVERGSFSAAARHLNVPKSSLSKRISQLEAELGARLIHRTSRSFVLSDAGRAFHDHARAALIEAEAAEAVVRQRLAEPAGTVRLTASVPITQFDLAVHLPALARAYPRLTVEVHTTDRFVDIVQDGFDIALRSHFAPLPDSTLVQKRLRVEPVFLVAAPAYLSAAAPLLSPADLQTHDALLTGPANNSWRLRNQAGDDIQVVPRPRMVADDSLVLLRGAAAGLGVTCLPESICSSDIASGSLVRVLPDWTAGSVTTTILMTHRRGQLPSVRAVVAFLAERLT